MSHPITHPKVPVTKLSKGYEARCHHCDWTYLETIRAAVTEQAQYHRHLHREGRIPSEGDHR